MTAYNLRQILKASNNMNHSIMNLQYSLNPWSKVGELPTRSSQTVNTISARWLNSDTHWNCSQCSKARTTKSPTPWLNVQSTFSDDTLVVPLPLSLPPLVRHTECWFFTTSNSLRNASFITQLPKITDNREGSIRISSEFVWVWRQTLLEHVFEMTHVSNSKQNSSVIRWLPVM